MSYDPLDSQWRGARTLHRHEKRCTKCGEVKPVEEFNRRLALVDGLQKHCKVCHRAENIHENMTPARLLRKSQTDTLHNQRRQIELARQRAEEAY